MKQQRTVSQQRERLRQRNPALVDAIDFYEDKLASNPTMPRYNHCLAAITSAVNDNEKADNHYRQAILAAPNNVMIRNDFALHLAKQQHKDEAIKELEKARLYVEENATLEKNLGAMLGRKGDYRNALQHTLQARILNPDDAMAHRNLARIYSTLGDNHTAFKHNLTSIQLEDPRTMKPNTSAYRAAAVQIIARGGDRQEAIAYMTAARNIENKHIDLPTSQRTNELLFKIRRKQAYQMELLEKERQEKEARRKASEEEWKKMIRIRDA